MKQSEMPNIIAAGMTSDQYWDQKNVDEDDRTVLRYVRLDIFRELVDAIINSETARDIDAGENGYGTVARALVVLGDYPDAEAASKAVIWPDADDWDEGIEDESNK